MNFSSPSKIQSAISNIQTAEILRSQQRALLNEFFNGARPWTEKEAEENKVLINFNSKEGVNILHQARAQYSNAFLKMENFFKVIVDAPPDKQQEFSAVITKAINKRMKASRSYLHSQREKFAGVVLHGFGGQIWWDDQRWLPCSMSINEILLPTDTGLTTDTWMYFSVRRKMRPGELFKMTLGKEEKNRDPAWNMPAVTTILDEYKELNVNKEGYDFANHPEKMAELYKQNLSYYDSDSAPVIWVQDFFHREEGEGDLKPGWYRKLLLDKDNVSIGSNKILDDEGEPQFIYEGKRPFASSLDSIITVQYGDGNNVPPFMHHSVRSLAYLLYELMWTMNRLNCQFTQCVFEQLMSWFKVQDPGDRARLDKMLLTPPFAIIPDGISMVTAQERYKPDPGMVTLLQQQYAQKIGETTSSYTQNIDQTGGRERKVVEVEALMSQMSQQMSTMLALAYDQEWFAYHEICRRFCIPNSSDPDVRKFRSECVNAGVDEKYLNVEKWDIIVEQVLGGGNKVLEIAQARELRNMRPTLNPESQQEVDRMFVTALTDNPKLADFIIPREKVVSDAVHDAELAFGALMMGVPVTPKPGFNHAEQAETVIKLMAGAVHRIAQTDGVGTQAEIIGLGTAAQYAGKHVQMLAEDKESKALVKELNDALKNLMNMVKAFQQRLQEKAQSQNGAPPDPETISKIQSQKASDALKLKSKQQSHQQKLQQKDQSFKADVQRKNMQALADTRVEAGKAIAQVHVEGLKAAAKSRLSSLEGPKE